jgi:signal transduction histidine kinase
MNRVSLREITDNSINAMQRLSHEMEQTIHVRYETKRDVILGNKIALNRIINNLISNAIKFTPEGKMITITTNCTELKTTIIVADTGTGISEKDQKRLFKTETHFTKTGTANEIGTGLGLIITREFIKLNDGKLDLESKIGQGSTFKVTLPGKRNNKL